MIDCLRTPPSQCVTKGSKPEVLGKVVVSCTVSASSDHPFPSVLPLSNGTLRIWGVLSLDRPKKRNSATQMLELMANGLLRTCAPPLWVESNAYFLAGQSGESALSIVAPGTQHVISERGGHAELCHGHDFLCVRDARTGATDSEGANDGRDPTRAFH